MKPSKIIQQRTQRTKIRSLESKRQIEAIMPPPGIARQYIQERAIHLPAIVNLPLEQLIYLLQLGLVYDGPWEEPRDQTAAIPLIGVFRSTEIAPVVMTWETL